MTKQWGYSFGIFYSQPHIKTNFIAFDSKCYSRGCSIIFKSNAFQIYERRVAILSGHFGLRRPKVQGPQDPRASTAQVASLI